MQKYIIQTNHLGLRLLEKNDIHYLESLESDSEVKKFFPNGASTREQVVARINDFISYYEEKGLPSFVMFELESGEFIGRCGFAPVETGEIEVGYVLHKKFWNKGYASEALTALLEWAKQNINADYIIAFAPVGHIASQRVMQKCGMKHYKNDIAKGVSCSFYRIKNLN
ncbi:MAG: GNAT family N-acetyltransferase [Gammaproteobacteria bacterium]|nr:GNAT family N-acetyltransferase [Gammaproteobacteria bacterium]